METVFDLPLVIRPGQAEALAEAARGMGFSSAQAAEGAKAMSAALRSTWEE